jgi:hypothetical protein
LRLKFHDRQRALFLFAAEKDSGMSVRTMDQSQIELVAAARAGVPFSELVKRFELDEARLKQINEEFESVPDAILLGIRRILKDNLGLKKIIADLVAKSVSKPALANTPSGTHGA